MLSWSATRPRACHLLNTISPVVEWPQVGDLDNRPQEDIMKRVNRWVGGIVLALLGLGVAPSANAQGDTWFQLDIVSVVPDKLDDYADLQFKDVNPALQKAGVPWRTVLRTAEFGNSYEMLLVRPIDDFGDEYDTGGPLARALAPDKRQRLAERLRRLTVSRERYAIRSRPDLSIEGASASLPLVRITTIQVAPGRTQDWEQFMRSSLPKFTEADLEFLVYERVLGPGPSTWLIVENISSFAQVTQPSLLVRAFGEEASSATALIAGAVTSIEQTVLRRDAELSFTNVASGPR